MLNNVLLPDISQGLSLLENHPEILKNGISRGLEREALRIHAQGKLSTRAHPVKFGSALTHPWITTDFSESLLEFVTPVNTSAEQMLAFLRDIHRHVSAHLNENEERLWPFSMPLKIENADDIPLANYGNSNSGLLKTLYRQGLKHRYGALMQVISGVHYNFSLSSDFWALNAKNKQDADADFQSEGYLSLIRNYYRFGWIIAYLFGASPLIDPSFLLGKKNAYPFSYAKDGMLYLPYATSLRLSDLGYNSAEQRHLNITFNHLHEYVSALKRGTQTPSAIFSSLGIKDKNNHRLQINTHILQNENEFYATIRPKRVTKPGESPSDALLRDGIEYLEIRALDCNPFSAQGIDIEQIRFLDLFLIWCALLPSPFMDVADLNSARQNWQNVSFEGRKPSQSINSEHSSKPLLLADLGKAIFRDLTKIAAIIDNQKKNSDYREVCEKWVNAFDHPELTYSARLLKEVKKEGFLHTGIIWAEKYHQELLHEQQEILTDADFEHQAQCSLQLQHQIEASDTLNFDDYLQKLIKIV